MPVDDDQSRVGRKGLDGTASESRSVETQGTALLDQFGLDDWKVIVVHEQDDLGDEDDIRGSYGRCYFDEKVICVNGRYAASPGLVDQIIRHEIAHAMLGRADHGPEFQAMARNAGCTPRGCQGEPMR
ncbi:MAG: SprT-like domain-containing protein [Candidatus Acidiferrales bacterium]